MYLRQTMQTILPDKRNALSSSNPPPNWFANHSGKRENKGNPKSIFVCKKEKKAITSEKGANYLSAEFIYNSSCIVIHIMRLCSM